MAFASQADFYRPFQMIKQGVTGGFDLYDRYKKGGTEDERRQKMRLQNEEATQLKTLRQQNADNDAKRLGLEEKRFNYWEKMASQDVADRQKKEAAKDALANPALYGTKTVSKTLPDEQIDVFTPKKTPELNISDAFDLQLPEGSVIGQESSKQFSQPAVAPTAPAGPKNPYDSSYSEIRPSDPRWKNILKKGANAAMSLGVEPAKAGYELGGKISDKTNEIADWLTSPDSPAVPAPPDSQIAGPSMGGSFVPKAGSVPANLSEMQIPEVGFGLELPQEQIPSAPEGFTMPGGVEKSQIPMTWKDLTPDARMSFATKAVESGLIPNPLLAPQAFNQIASQAQGQNYFPQVLPQVATPLMDTSGKLLGNLDPEGKLIEPKALSEFVAKEFLARNLPIPQGMTEGQALQLISTMKGSNNTIDAETADSLGIPILPKADPELKKEEYKRMGEITDTARSSSGQIPSLQSLRSLTQEVSTGRFVGSDPAVFFRRLAGDGKLETFQSMIDRLTPGQRQGLPGAASENDVKMFKSSLPSLSRTKEGNLMIVDGLIALKKRDESMAQFLRKTRDAGASLEAAEGSWNEYISSTPLFDPKTGAPLDKVVSPEEFFKSKQIPDVTGGLVAPPEKVRVISPDGKTGTVSALKLDEAMRSGYRKLD